MPRPLLWIKCLAFLFCLDSEVWPVYNTTSCEPRLTYLTRKCTNAINKVPGVQASIFQARTELSRALN
jgi:hypothetical protein